MFEPWLQTQCLALVLSPCSQGTKTNKLMLYYLLMKRMDLHFIFSAISSSLMESDIQENYCENDGFFLLFPTGKDCDEL